jgi:hypothetical protein
MEDYAVSGNSVTAVRRHSHSKFVCHYKTANIIRWEPTTDPLVNISQGISQGIAMSSPLSAISQRGTNRGGWVAQATKFWNVAPNICELRYKTCFTLPFCRLDFLTWLFKFWSHGLDGRGSKPPWGRDFPHPSRPALEPTHNAYRTSFPVAELPRNGVDHTRPFSAKVKEIVELYLYSHSEPSWWNVRFKFFLYSINFRKFAYLWLRQ